MDSSVRQSSKAYWGCQLSGWSVYSAVQIAGAVFLMRLPWARVSPETVALNGLGLILTHLLHAYILRHNWSALHFGSLVQRIVVASLIIAVPMALIGPFALIAALQNSDELVRELAPALQPHFTPL